MSVKSTKSIIVALDYAELNPALTLIEKLDPQLCRLKIGKEMFTRFGPTVVEKIMKKNFDVFLDLKFHDIPNTVAKACKAAADLGVWMMNVHSLGGRDMLMAAREAIDNYGSKKPILVAVTLLTSMNESAAAEVGLRGNVDEIVNRLAQLAKECGLEGVVCSAKEAPLLRKNYGPEFCLVTPGIRLHQEVSDDQKRVMTPEEAMAAGASYIVIGRPITQAADPLDVLHQIQRLSGR